MLTTHLMGARVGSWTASPLHASICGETCSLDWPLQRCSVLLSVARVPPVVERPVAALRLFEDVAAVLLEGARSRSTGGGAERLSPHPGPGRAPGQPGGHRATGHRHDACAVQCLHLRLELRMLSKTALVASRSLAMLSGQDGKCCGLRILAFVSAMRAQRVHASPTQPKGLHPRRPVQGAHRASVIGGALRSYLVHWVAHGLRRALRPLSGIILVPHLPTCLSSPVTVVRLGGRGSVVGRLLGCGQPRRRAVRRGALVERRNEGGSQCPEGGGSGNGGRSAALGGGNGSRGAALGRCIDRNIADFARDAQHAALPSQGGDGAGTRRGHCPLSRPEGSAEASGPRARRDGAPAQPETARTAPS